MRSLSALSSQLSLPVAGSHRHWTRGLMPEEHLWGPRDYFRSPFIHYRLHRAGTDMAVQRELLRHADIQTTMNIYTQAVSADKRVAIQQVVKVLLNA